MESGTSVAQREAVDLAALLTDVAADAAFEARSDGRDVLLRELQALQVEGTPALLHSAFENILRNAVRFTAQGTAVEVDVQRCADDEERVCISVRDYGPGVPDELLERLFDPFVRVEQARERARGSEGYPVPAPVCPRRRTGRPIGAPSTPRAARERDGV